MWCQPVDEAFCRALPKVDLHAHFGGSIRNSTLQQLLVERGRSPAEARALAAKCVIHGVDTKRTPTQQMEMFRIVSSALSTAEEMRTCARQFLLDCAADGVVYAELRTGGTRKHKVETILDAMARAEHELGLGKDCAEWAAARVKMAPSSADDCKDNDKDNEDATKPVPRGPCRARLLLSVKRDMSVKQAEDVIKHAASLYGRGVVGLDFCGDSRSGTFDRFVPLFTYARKQHGMKFSIHFAEQPSEPDLQAILDVRPDRLGHGCFMSSGIRQQVQELDIPLECCLASNINTMRLIKRGVLDHPVVGWWRDNMSIVPCTDNVGLLESPLSRHYAMLATAVGASPEQLTKLSLKTTDYVFDGPDADLRSWCRTLVQQFDYSSWQQQQQQQGDDKAE